MNSGSSPAHRLGQWPESTTETSREQGSDLAANSTSLDPAAAQAPNLASKQLKTPLATPVVTKNSEPSAQPLSLEAPRRAHLQASGQADACISGNPERSSTFPRLLTESVNSHQGSLLAQPTRASTPKYKVQTKFSHHVSFRDEQPSEEQSQKSQNELLLYQLVPSSVTKDLTQQLSTATQFQHKPLALRPKTNDPSKPTLQAPRNGGEQALRSSTLKQPPPPPPQAAVRHGTQGSNGNSAVDLPLTMVQMRPKASIKRQSSAASHDPSEHDDDGSANKRPRTAKLPIRPAQQADTVASGETRSPRSLPFRPSTRLRRARARPPILASESELMDMEREETLEEIQARRPSAPLLQHRELPEPLPNSFVPLPPILNSFTFEPPVQPTVNPFAMVLPAAPGLVPNGNPPPGPPPGLPPGPLPAFLAQNQPNIQPTNMLTPPNTP